MDLKNLLAATVNNKGISIWLLFFNKKQISKNFDENYFFLNSSSKKTGAYPSVCACFF
jgi:hypothetical protein